MLLEKTREGLEKRFFDRCLAIIKEEGFDLYDLNYLKGSQTLRVFIRNPETKTADLNDCIKIDKALTPFIDEEDWVPDSLVLEVSSPGIYRNLSTKEHFVEAIGEIVSITIMGNLDESLNQDLPNNIAKTKKFRGELASVEAEYIKIECSKSLVTIKFEQIKKAHIDPELEDLT